MHDSNDSSASTYSSILHVLGGAAFEMGPTRRSLLLAENTTTMELRLSYTRRKILKVERVSREKSTLATSGMYLLFQSIWLAKGIACARNLSLWKRSSR